jgi:hypothetical protein
VPSRACSLDVLGDRGERKQPDPDPKPLRLLGCEPRGRLVAALKSGDDQFGLGGAYLGPVDRMGRAIEEHWTCLHVESWSAPGTGRVDSC